jgi:Mrp family chromosome partitioning ATPase/capsular polysaccharide biosynthesis protein
MNQTTDANAIFAPIWKRKWLILIVAVLVAAGSYYYYERKPKIYSSTTQVYLGNGAEEQQQLGGTGGGSGKKAASADPATQALLIDSSIIKDAVHARLRKEHKSAAVRAALKGKTKAKAATKSEFITINGEAHNARGAALVVNVTAQEYIKRENAHHRKEVQDALGLARRQLRKIEAGAALRASSKSKSGKGSSSSSATSTLQSATLSNKINQLEADLPIMEVTQVDPATRKGTKLLSPHPKKNAIFGFAIGLLLASLAAYLRGRFDRRLRSMSAIEAAYQMQILTALQAVRRPLVSRDGHPAPAKSLLEPLWRLQTTLQVGSASANGLATNGAAANGHGSPPRVILCVSADPGDGKSTLVATLALAMADTGERVAVVEADFRRPVQAKLLGAAGQAGLADVLSGRLTLAEALQTVSHVRSEAGVVAAPAAVGAPATVVESSGTIALLAGSVGVANPPALLSRSTMTELPRTLAGEFEYVLVDAPSPLQVSDVMPLLAAVDGIVIVARVGHTRENSAERLVQLLQHTPSAPVLGVVANAVSQKDVQKYGLAGQQGRQWRQLIGR